MTMTEERTEMLPDVVEWYEAIQKAEADYHAEYDGTNYPAAAYKRNNAIYAAWSKLEQSSNPLVAWIAKNTKDYRTYAEKILKRLRPDTTIQQLDEIARSYNWCEEYDTLRDQAIEAGVLPKAAVKVRYKVNGWEWETMHNPVRVRSGRPPVTREEIADLFRKGVNFIQLEADGSLYRFEPDPS